MVNNELEKLATKLYKELIEAVEELGGTVDEFNPDSRIISVTVEPEAQEYLTKILDDLTARYDKKKHDLIRNDPFFGVKVILSE